MSMYFIVAIVFGIVAAIIARTKGRNSLGWFVAGLIIGPFALIVAVLPPIAREGKLVECPSCLEVSPLGARICRHWGQRVAVTA